ncbi:hypothetical protein AMIS_27720 [Actinoplanes missouriensis 431]|uniref:Integral membrane protein n=1 Tax=Actinoplanes missouriensis (strain ATCC 14538 / DSM 43046 / CBS 188.64 / JCM 3121 / NBRC 102363 / NCIMB 12654 / NRRL B-3342 / UNCC 431) TaxID=512565 RepID=I0H4Q5_ACTM4|nr:DoxX family protein [Actinoplanes missouriensis]BAL87992.1 hypothetical protein AMIS_27720 [Actinoplanes missouriensis 431]
MYTAYLAVTVVTAALNLAAAAADFLCAAWVLDNLRRYGLPRSWIVPLGWAKAAGGVGLLAGLAVPVLGALAAVCLVGYFIGAVGVVARARCFSHLPAPGLFLLSAVAVLLLQRGAS